MKKKGFTLIELLAVIVILAILMVVAVPKILDVIENSRQSAVKSSTELYIDAVEYYQTMQSIKNKKILPEGTYNVATESEVNGNKYKSLNDLISVKGKKPTGGTIGISKNSKVSTAYMCMNDYVVEYANRKVNILDNDCGDMSLIINFSTDSENWETQKTLTITYPEGDYEYYFNLESGSATYNDEEITIGEDIKAEKNSIQLVLKENSKVSAWIIKNGNKKSLRTYEEKMIDDSVLEAPSLSATATYPIITADGISTKTYINIDDDNNPDTVFYYSIDNGVNWIKYVNPTTIDAVNIKAKNVKNNGRSSEISEVVSTLAQDSITSEAYDGDFESFMTYHTGYNGLDNYDNSTWNKYILVDSELWGYELNIKWYCWNYSGFTAYIDFVDDNDNILPEYSLRGGATANEFYTIPSGTTKIKYRMNKLSDYNWSTNSKLFEIKLSSNPKIIPINDYPLLTKTGTTYNNSDKIDVKLQYNDLNDQKLYNIDGGSWLQGENKTITLSLNQTISIKGISKNGKETDEISYTAINPTDILSSNATDNDDTTIVDGSSLTNKTVYLRISDDMKGKKVRIKWRDNNSGAVIYHYFANYKKTEIGNTRVQLGNLKTVDAQYDIPKNAEYLVMYIGASCYVYEVNPIYE